MSKDTITLHRLSGDEVFEISSAVLMHWKESQGETALNFEIETIPQPIKTIPQAEGSPYHPSAEWTVYLPVEEPFLEYDPQVPGGLSVLAGRVFEIKEGWDEEHDLMARLYYFEHDPLQDNRIEIETVEGDRLRVRITGKRKDHDFGGGDFVQIETEAWFTFHR